MRDKMGKLGLTVACLISPVAVWPAQNTRPGIRLAGLLCGLGGNFSLEISWRDMVQVKMRVRFVLVVVRITFFEWLTEL